MSATGPRSPPRRLLPGPPRPRPRRCPTRAAAAGGAGRTTGGGATRASPRGRGPAAAGAGGAGGRRPRAGCPARRTAPCRAACGSRPRSPGRRGAGPPRRHGPAVSAGNPAEASSASRSASWVPSQPSGSADSSRTKTRLARVPAGEPGVVVGAVEAARAARHRFQQVGPPDRLADLDGLRRVDRPLQLAAAEHPQFEPDAVLGSLLALARIRIHEVQVPHDHADPLESEGIEHRDPLPGRDQFPGPVSVILTRAAATAGPRLGQAGTVVGGRRVCGQAEHSPSRSQATTEGTGDHDRAY